MHPTIMKRKLGKTDISVSEIGLGGAQFGNLYQVMSDQQASDIMAFWFKQGVTLFDSAPYYGFGLSETRMGDFLQQFGLQEEIILSTKAGRVLNPISSADQTIARCGFYSPMAFDAEFDYSYGGIMQSFFDSQSRMQDRSADILLIHDIGQMTHSQNHEIYLQQLLDGGLRALQELKQAGDIRAFGIGVNEVEVCQQLLDVCEPDCLLLAGRYTLLEQSALNQLLPRCLQQGVSVMAGGVFNSGILATTDSQHGKAQQNYYNYHPAPVKIQQKVQRLRQVCAHYHVPLPAAAMQFCLAHPAICSVLLGNNSLDQAQQNLRYYQTKIPNAFWHELKHLNLIEQHAPVPFNTSVPCSNSVH